MPFGRIEHDAELSLAGARSRDEITQGGVDAEARILEIHRIDRMLGYRNLDPRLGDDALGPEADDASQTTPRPPFDHAVQIDETDGLAVAIRMRDAGAQPACHERQMRIGVLRLRGALNRVQIGAAVELIVFVAGAFREQRAERFHIRGDVLCAQPCRDASVEETSRRVGRPVQAVRILGERPVFRREPGPHLHHVEARFRGHLEREIQRFTGGHASG